MEEERSASPHKPLLLILALADLQNNKNRLMAFEEVFERLSHLLIDFGPQRKSYHPELPFWRLQNDGEFWEIPVSDSIMRHQGVYSRNTNVSSKILKSFNTCGGFTQAAYSFLKSHPEIVNQLVTDLLDSHFPASMHESILDAVGMPWKQIGPAGRKRSSEFRDMVLRIYEYRCAICGFDGRLGTQDLALEAAHIKWFAAGGPDTEKNGLALCVFHHRMFDRGAIGLGNNSEIIISQLVNGGRQVQELLIKYSGQKLRNPQTKEYRPNSEFVDWHYNEVFRKPGRISQIDYQF